MTTTNKLLADFDFTPTYKVDYIYQDDFSGLDILKIAEYKSLWGQGIDEPLLVFENVKVTSNSLTLMGLAKGKPTLKITAPNGVDFIRFRSSSEEFENLSSSTGYVTINIIGKAKRNVWNGNINPQIEIVAYEVIQREKYYF